ncbi:MAG: RNA methyltransferase [Acetobacterales bacterium]
MAGTDGRHHGEGGGPVVVLVRPQLGENIGAAARAMLNCGLDRLRIVAPRDGWPSESAIASAAGADDVLERAQLFDTAAGAVADLRRVYATTARSRDMTKPVLGPRAAVAEARAADPDGGSLGFLFGPERTGLTNDETTLADALVIAPLNPAFSSLNLAQAVLMVAWEWRMAGFGDTAGRTLTMSATRPATRAELVNFFEHLERELDECGFLRPPEKRPAMVRNIRNLFLRGEPTEQEVRTLHGIVAGLIRRRQPED